ncbi:hypothetical protein BDF19DRAFT_109773 [Syncephalis fuscata]|nr:hypothetical protein BDF19DRAFT_109773 [Syncephalis fuscata]
MVYETVFLEGRRPKQVLDHFSGRFKKARILHEDVAALMRERAAVEEQYAKQIQRLVRRGRAVVDAEFLGMFGELWGRIKSEWEETATLHLKFAENIIDQVEKPIRQCIANDDSWQSIRQLDVTAQKVAKELEEKDNKLIKARKGSNTGLSIIKSANNNERRVADLTVKIDELRAQWQRDASTLLVRYESVDRVRLNNLKEAVTRLQTLQSDCAHAYTELLDRTLAIAFDFDPEEDIVRVCASSIGTDSNQFVNGSSLSGRGVYLNDQSTAASSTNIQRSTLSLPNGCSPRMSLSSDSISAHPKSATPSRSDLRRGALNATTDGRPLSEVQEVDTATLGTNRSSQHENQPNIESTHSLSSITAPATWHGGINAAVTTTKVDTVPISAVPSRANDSHTNSSMVARAHLEEPSDASNVSNDNQHDGVAESVNGNKAVTEEYTVMSSIKVIPQRLNISTVRTITIRPASMYTSSNSTHDCSTSSSPVDAPESPRLSAIAVQQGGHSPLKVERSLGLQRRITRRSSTRDPDVRRASAAVDPSKFQQVARSLSLETTGKKSSSSLSTSFLPASASSPLSQQQPVVYVAEPMDENEDDSLTVMPPSISGSSSPLSERNPFAASITVATPPTSESVRNQYNPFAPAIAIQPASPSFAPSITAPVKPTIGLTITETIHAICESTGWPVKTIIYGELSVQSTHTTTSSDQMCTLLLSDSNEQPLNELSLIDTNATMAVSDAFDALTALTCQITDQPLPIATWQVHSITTTTAEDTPLLIQAAWRIESNGASLAIQYRRNPACTRLAAADLRQLSFLLPLNELGGGVVQVQARPSGYWDENHARLLWQIDEDIRAGDDAPRRILARLTTNATIIDESSLPPVAARFEASYSVAGLTTTIDDATSAQSIGPLGVSSLLVRTSDATVSSATVQVRSGKYIATS